MEINLNIFRFIFYIIAITVLVGCSNGKIDYRGKCQGSVWNKYDGGKKIYLVNTSRSKKVTFTVKMSHDKEGNENIIYRTELYTLNPGEEVELDCSRYIFQLRADKEIVIKNNYEIVGELEEK